MLDTTKIIKELGLLIGWRQNPDPQGEQIQDDITVSKTGQYYNDFHAMITLDNIISIVKDDSEFVYPDFVEGDEYKVGAKVQHDDKTFIKIGEGATVPGANEDDWKEYHYLSSWIETKTNAFIIQAFNEWYYKKSELKTGNGVLSYDVLFANPGDATDANDIVLVSEGERVGLKIKTGKSIHMKHVCHALAFQMEQNQEFTVNVYDMQKQDPIFTKLINYQGGGLQEWHEVNFKMQGGGEYRIEYVSPSTLNSPITSMHGAEMPYTKFYKVEGMRDGDKENENFGIDLKLSVSCDYTQLIIDQKEVFIDLVGKRVAMGFLREFIYNPNARLNRNEKNVDDQQLLYEIDGDSQGTKGNNNGLAKQYEKALNAVGFDRSNIDSVCLPCQRNGLRYTTTG